MIEHTHTLTKIIKRKKGEEEIFLSRLNQSYAAPPYRGGPRTSNTTFKDVV
jgi:hypothetical protein